MPPTSKLAVLLQALRTELQEIPLREHCILPLQLYLSCVNLPYSVLEPNKVKREGSKEYKPASKQAQRNWPGRK